MRELVMGSRDSRLALAQTELMLKELRARRPQYAWTVRSMKTQGDLLLNMPLDQLGGKGLFVKELDRALLEGRLDAAVHSLKDLPMEAPEGLRIGAYSLREDPRDALVLPLGQREPDTVKPIGTGSPRRRLQLARLYPTWPSAPIRGNVLSRLDKLDKGEYGAVVLAVAALKRLGLTHRIHRIFTVDEMLPAAGQGVLAMLVRDPVDDPVSQLARELAASVEDEESRLCVEAERAFVRTLDGGCSAPVAAYGELEGDALLLRGLYAPPGAPELRDRICGAKGEGALLGERLALRLLARVPGQDQGKVWLVGAGPGDPGLLTVKAARLLSQAQVVLVDRLVGPGVLARIPAGAERIYVGKIPGRHHLDQGAINRIMAKKAAQGKRVVRLKGGDPFLFGRGAEELDCLKDAGISFEVVPGVSSALGVPAYGGIPVTHRDYGSSVHIITGHNKEGADTGIPYKALVQAGGTMIFLMGTSALEGICRGLCHAGLDPETPGAVLEQGTTARQRTVLAPVSRLKAETDKAGIKAPAVVVIGNVCSLAGRFAWFETQPLAGLRIGVCRPWGKEARLSDRLSDAGAEVVCLPTIETVPLAEPPDLEEALAALKGGDWLAFTSAEGVGVFFMALKAARRDIRSLAGFRFAAVGGATASALEDRGILVDLIPEHASGLTLGTALAQAMHPGERVLIPRSRIGTPEILVPLKEAGLDFTDIPLYDTAPAGGDKEPWYRELLLAGLDWLVFTSPSTVEGFRALAEGTEVSRIKALCIGKRTAAAAARYGMETVVADTPCIDSLGATLTTCRGGIAPDRPCA
ncbi:MAG: uroporphyrinogen-III C-methyltransferase [Spirochaetaceae bacterium]|jgi:uroporphyrinogen III methyltransferase/synthase|nr:uroporphyrinogen-III C-methyltransferase [Spirochaetaceae bacterium]